MSIHFFWGDDEFSLGQAVDLLQKRALDPQWASFNYDKLPPEQSDAIRQALSLAMTPPFGTGQRVVWLVETTLSQGCGEAVLQELEQTLPMVPETTVLLLTSRTKPNGRLKSTKLLQQYGEIREFSAIPGWKTEELVKRVGQMAQEHGVSLTAKATEVLAEVVGSDLRRLQGELGKLSLYTQSMNGPLDERAIAQLVAVTTQSSLKLATAIREGKTALALGLVGELMGCNEPGLRIVATLVRQFRTWLWVKLLSEGRSSQDRVQQIAQMADIGNPKRVYFLQREVTALSVEQLQRTLPVLLELELQLKQGREELATLQTKVIELCQICQSRVGRW